MSLTLGMWGFANARRTLAARVVATWVIAQLVLVALSATNAGPRYRAPLEPGLLVLAAAARRRV